MSLLNHENSYRNFGTILHADCENFQTQGADILNFVISSIPLSEGAPSIHHDVINIRGNLFFMTQESELCLKCCIFRCCLLLVFFAFFCFGFFNSLFWRRTLICIRLCFYYLFYYNMGNCHYNDFLMSKGLIAMLYWGKKT